jgi:hypothetical protein
LRGQIFGILCRANFLEEATLRAIVAILSILTYTALLTLATVAPASACRHYSIWGFPWAQRCSGSTSVPAAPVPPTSPVRDTDMPLPNLTPVDGGEADESTRGRLLLHAALAR